MRVVCEKAPRVGIPAIEYQLRLIRTYETDKDAVKLGMMLHMGALTLPLDKVAIGLYLEIRSAPLGLRQLCLQPTRTRAAAR